jgi:hypothetical protein
MGSTLSKPVRHIKQTIWEKKRGALVQVTGPHPRKAYSKSRTLTQTEFDSSPRIPQAKDSTLANNLRITF